MKKVLVTGGNGFTGRYLVPLLKSAGFETISLEHDEIKGVSVSGRVDITKYEDLKRLLHHVEPQYIIHLAGISFANHPRPLELYDVNLLGTENLLRATYETVPNLKKIILASSASIYGSCNSTHIDETVCPSPVNHYAVSKLAMEHMAKTWMSQLPIIIVRPFNYTGPGQDKKFLIPKIIYHYSKKLPTIELGNVNVARDFTDIRIICQYYLKLLKENINAGQIVNLCSGRLISLTEILTSMNHMTGHYLEVKINPDFVRESDVLELRGNPDKLYSMIGRQIHPDMVETLKWMLDQAC